MSRILLTIPDELLHQFDAYCEKYSYERSEFIKSLIRDKLFRPASGSPKDTVRPPVTPQSEAPKNDIGKLSYI